MLFTAMIFAVQACKKDKNKEREKTIQEKILGKWTYVSRTVTTTKPPSIDTNPAEPGDYMEFRADGKIQVRMNGAERTGNYSINAENKLLVEDEAYDIDELNDKKLTFSISEKDGDNIDKLSYNLSK
ncbi:hypothetical protein SAMN04488522_101903 [Pedobacter caeni]|uniref:Lipocalin-like domain-containing protein n=2 Tax=Pedobacter caeni TaxID=288992 RepID=A0A1M4VH34_9SPHI|nr:hypothetical protein SAMN04488522_101903 [Pedobacter caeni]